MVPNKFSMRQRKSHNRVLQVFLEWSLQRTNVLSCFPLLISRHELEQTNEGAGPTGASTERLNKFMGKKKKKLKLEFILAQNQFQIHAQFFRKVHFSSSV